MRRLFAALLLSASALTPALAQDVLPELVAQQQLLQSMLNDAIVALRANNKPQECSLRSQALAILNTNIQGFEAAFPANNWSDLQTSLQGSMAHCSAKGF